MASVIVLNDLASGVLSVEAGTGVSVDATDPQHPIVSSTLTDTDTGIEIDSPREDAVLSCLDDEGSAAVATGVTIHSDANDKLETLASFGAFHSNSDGSTITFDFDVADQHQVTLGGNRTLAFSHANVGQRVTILLFQDGTGNRTPTWWSNIAWDKGIAPRIDPTPAGWNLVVLECVGTDGYSVPLWKEVSRSTSAPRHGITQATDGATVTFDLRLSRKQQVTLGGNRTLALAAGSFYAGQEFFLKLIQDGTGSRTVTWFSGINWPSDLEPVLTATAGRSDWFAFICTDASGSPKFDGFTLDLDFGS